MTYKLDDGREIAHGAKVKIIVEGDTGYQLRGRLVNVIANRAYVMTADGILVGATACMSEIEPWGDSPGTQSRGVY